MLHIWLVIFISFIHTPKFICSCYAPKSNSFILSFISISFILQIIVNLIHIYHIWFCSYSIVFQPHCVFRFLNQSRFWKLEKLGVSLDKILIQNIYCIILKERRWFHCGYSKVPRLFEALRLLEEIR